MHAHAVLVVMVLILAPLGARAADLVVWWEKGLSAQEDEAVREIIAAFEEKTGKQVELVQPSNADFPATAEAAVQAGQPPDFMFGLSTTPTYYSQWAYEDRLVDLSDEIQPFASLFDPDALAFATLLNATTGRRALYALPMGFTTDHVHVWRSLLEQAGFTLDDIPKQWEAFWSFWCDRVQPAVRRATGRDDLWGVGLPMSAKAVDTRIQFDQFMQAYGADYVTREGELVIDDPEVRLRLIKTMDSYTAIYRKDCTPPDSVDWTMTVDNNNNERFLTQRVVMLPNDTLSVPNALKRERPRGLLREHCNGRMAGWRRRPAPRHLYLLPSGRGLQGRRARPPGQGVRALSRGRGLARPLSQFLRRAPAAVDAEAA
jgi:multiple sugar transport system substrate-binding protein